MATTINQLQKEPLTLTFVRADGQPTSPASAPSWSSSDTSVATVVPSADGHSAEVIPGNVGVATITVTVDGVSSSDEITVVAAPVTGVTIVEGAAVAL